MEYIFKNSIERHGNKIVYGMIIVFLLISGVFLFQSFNVTKDTYPKSMSCSKGFCYIYGEDIKKTGADEYIRLWFKEVKING